MSHTDQTADQFFTTLNGFDELAVVKFFDSPIHLMHPDSGGSPFMFLRAMAFVQYRREHHRDAEAFDLAMTLSVDAANTFFAEAPAAELDPSDPDTAEGKDDTPSD